MRKYYNSNAENAFLFFICRSAAGSHPAARRISRDVADALPRTNMEKEKTSRARVTSVVVMETAGPSRYSNERLGWPPLVPSALTREATQATAELSSYCKHIVRVELAVNDGLVNFPRKLSSLVLLAPAYEARTGPSFIVAVTSNARDGVLRSHPAPSELGYNRGGALPGRRWKRSAAVLLFPSGSRNYRQPFPLCSRESAPLQFYFVSHWSARPFSRCIFEEQIPRSFQPGNRGSWSKIHVAPRKLRRTKEWSDAFCLNSFTASGRCV